MKPIALLPCALLLLPAASRACLNDRDTLETEARGVPDVMRALSGRFERNPPLFYEMRLARVAQEIATSPARLDLYDDAAVACDRLHRSTEALAWIEKKRAQLQVLDAQNPQVREHWYRYYANAGTFRAHGWIVGGADRKKLSEMEAARALIAKAVAMKPGAHFGREKYQLKAMDWILKPPPIKDGANPIPDILGLNKEDYAPHSQSEGLADLKKRGYQDAERGLTGLITLGAAWQSVDVFNALRHVEVWRNDGKVVYLLNLRLQEMIGAGRKSLHPQAPKMSEMAGYFDPTMSAVVMGSSRVYGAEAQHAEASYKKLRAEADAWHARRTAWMLERLKAGRHPDTDSTFWSGWDDGSPPPLRPQTVWEARLGALAPIAPALSLVLLSGALGALVVRKRRSRRALA